MMENMLYVCMECNKKMIGENKGGYRCVCCGGSLKVLGREKKIRERALRGLEDLDNAINMNVANTQRKHSDLLKMNINIDMKDYQNKLDELTNKLMEISKLQEELNDTTIGITIGK